MGVDRLYTGFLEVVRFFYENLRRGGILSIKSSPSWVRISQNPHPDRRSEENPHPEILTQIGVDTKNPKKSQNPHPDRRSGKNPHPEILTQSEADFILRGGYPRPA